MFSELEDYIRNITTPENLDIMKQSYSLLNKAGWLSHQVDMEPILNSADKNITDNNLLAIHNLLFEYMEESINQFGVQLADGIDLHNLNPILAGLLHFADYGDPDAILSIMEIEQSAEEKLCDMLGLVSKQNSHYFDPLITQVDDGLITAIQIKANENMPAEDVRADIAPYRKRFDPFKKLYVNTIGEQAIQNGFGFGTPIDRLVHHYNDQLIELEKHPQQLAIAIVSLVLVSGLESQKLMDQANSILDDYSAGIDQTTKAHTQLVSLLKEYS